MPALTMYRGLVEALGVVPIAITASTSETTVNTGSPAPSDIGGAVFVVVYGNEPDSLQIAKPGSAIVLSRLVSEPA